MEQPVAVIILNYNGERLLPEYLPSVIRHTPSSIGRVIVADNCSSDSSVDIIKRDFPEVDLIQLDRNYGFAEGYNRVIRQVNARYTVLLNSDVAVKDDWLTPLYDYMCCHPDCGALQPKIHSVSDPGRFEYAGACGGFLDRDGYPYCRGRILDSVEHDCGQYDTPREVMWASGAAMMVNTRLYLKLGGLDPSFFAHMEEIDLCWRMRLAGFKVAVQPEATVFHLGGGTLAATNPRKVYLNFRNSLLMLHKNLPCGKVRNRFLLRRRLLDTLALGQYLLTGKWGFAGSILKAHRDYLKMRSSLSIPEAVDRNLLPETPEGRVSILWQGVIRGRRRYSELLFS